MADAEKEKEEEEEEEEVVEEEGKGKEKKSQCKGCTYAHLSTSIVTIIVISIFFSLGGKSLKTPKK